MCDSFTTKTQKKMEKVACNACSLIGDCSVVQERRRSFIARVLQAHPPQHARFRYNLFGGGYCPDVVASGCSSQI
ncbi:hypothetical protein C0J52_25965 [Blattella germanica]|nr:hypothetical protein C0J52_25965 [Blattella germanica]